jgi:hypothetical protein
VTVTTGEKLLDRIGALLAKAESTDSPHEAEALVAKAQQLATLHAVDLATARARTARRHRRQTPAQRKLVLGQPRQSGLRQRVHLYVAIAHANDVKVDVARDSTYVLAFGFPDDLDVVAALFASLATQMTAAANAAIARGEHHQDQYWSEAAGGWRSDARVFRRTFNDAFVAVVGRRLQAARAAALAEHDRAATSCRDGGDDGEAPVSGALVLAHKADEVAAYHRATSTARGTWRGGGAGTGWSQAGHESGTAAGRAARLTAAKDLPGARGSLPS